MRAPLLFGLLVTALPLSAQEAAPDKVPTEVQAELLKTFNDEFVEITPGQGKFPQSFRMGSLVGDPSEQPLHEITLRYTFSMAKYEIPQNLWEAVMGENPSKWKGPRNSAEMFSYTEADAFCKKTTLLMRQLKLISDQEEIRIPTEAEWEYCCRAGRGTAYSFGDKATADGDVEPKASLLDPYGWHTGNAAGNDPPVGALKPNAFGLYDMHGYLREFVSDHWHENYAGAPADGSAWLEPNDPVMIVRGGSWRDRHELLRSAARMPIPADAKSDAIGLRCIKARVPGKAE